MSIGATKYFEFEFSENNLQYVERLLYDVLSYTLPICGLPKTDLPTTDCKANIYKLPYFVESAGATVLTHSLSKREKWKETLISRQNICGFHYENIPQLMDDFLSSYHARKTRSKNSLVEVFPALCNEIMLFFHHERLNIDFNSLMKAFTVYIVSAIGFKQELSETTEELFPEYTHLFLYARWITHFIKKFAIPYGFRDDVPELFLKSFKRLWKPELQNPTNRESSVTIKVKNRESYHEILSYIRVKESVPFSVSLVVESVLRCDDESMQPKQLPKSSLFAFECEKCSCSETQLKRKAAIHQGILLDKPISGITGVEAGETPDIFIWRFVSEYRKSLEPPKFPEFSESDALRDSKSREELPTRSANPSDQSAQSGQSSENSSELGIVTYLKHVYECLKFYVLAIFDYQVYSNFLRSYV